VQFSATFPKYETLFSRRAKYIS